MSALYEYLVQTHERDIRRRAQQASARPSVRDISARKSDPATKEHR